MESTTYDLSADKKAAAPKIGFVSLGCPKALTDSELILTQLRAEGYETSKTFAGAEPDASSTDLSLAPGGQKSGAGTCVALRPSTPRLNKGVKT